MKETYQNGEFKIEKSSTLINKEQDPIRVSVFNITSEMYEIHLKIQEFFGEFEIIKASGFPKADSSLNCMFQNEKALNLTLAQDYGINLPDGWTSTPDEVEFLKSSKEAM